MLCKPKVPRRYNQVISLMGKWRVTASLSLAVAGLVWLLIWPRTVLPLLSTLLPRQLCLSPGPVRFLHLGTCLARKSSSLSAPELDSFARFCLQPAEWGGRSPPAGESELWAGLRPGLSTAVRKTQAHGSMTL